MTAATMDVSSGRKAGSILTRCVASPILTCSQPAIDLGGKLEGVAVVSQTGDHRVLAAELSDALRGPPGGAAFEPQVDRERLAVRRRPCGRAAPRAP